MRSRSIAKSALRFAGLLTFFASFAAAQTTWYVAPVPGPGSGTAASPFAVIQDALFAASSGDVVVVAPGTYVENVDFLGKDVTVRSSAGSHATVIDGGAVFPCVRFVSSETAAARLLGFTLTNGNAIDGGGILCVNSAPTVEDCVLVGNVAQNDGGGLHAFGAQPVLRDCDFIGNTSGTRGGGLSSVFGSTVSLERCVVFGNNCTGRGGGIATEQGDFHANDCRIEGNVATMDGGGVVVAGAGMSTLKRCVVTANVGDFGGGALNDGTALVFDACRLTANTARFSGGAVATFGATLMLMDNSLFAQNVAPGLGGAIYTTNSIFVVSNCTVADNNAVAGGAIYAFSPSPIASNSVYNTVLWGNTPDQVASQPGVTVGITFSDVQGGAAGASNLAVNPLFVNAAGLDYRLSPASPCINVGSNGLVTPLTTDLEGNPRILGAAVDLGADEYVATLPGTGDDLALGIAIEGRPQSVNTVPLAVGETLSITLESPFGGLSNGIPLIVASAFPTASPPPSFLGVVHVDLTALLFLVDGTAPLPPFFQPVIGTQGITINLPLSAPIGAGFTIRFQGAALSPLAGNGLFATTAALDVVGL